MVLPRRETGVTVRVLIKVISGKVLMGYYVRIDSVEWTIKESPEALQAIQGMPTKFKAIQRGGSSSGERWFSWMNDTSIESASSVQEVFNQLGFETETVDGGFQILSYDNKTGQEDLFLGYMAPFTVDGSTMEWIGEDDAHWRYEIVDGRMFTQEADIRWTNSQPYRYSHFTWEGNTTRHMAIDPFNCEAELAEAERINLAKQAEWDKARAEREKQESISLA